MAKLIIPTFAKGEVSPELFGRVDVQAYGAGLSLAKNAIVHTFGGVSNRPGLKFVGPVKDHLASTPRLVRFQFNRNDSYILEFGNLYMRVIRNGGYVVTNPIGITSVARTTPVRIRIPSHGLSDGDEIAIEGIVGTTELNGNRFQITDVDGNRVDLFRQDDQTSVSGAGMTQYVSGGTASKIFELTTPYTTAQLFELVFTQSADVITITHPDHPVRELARTADDNWSLSVAEFTSNIQRPQLDEVTVNTAGSEDTFRYFVTAVDLATGEESLSAIGVATSGRTITAITQASPGVVTTGGAANTILNGFELELSGIVGMEELNGRRVFAGNVAANSFELLDIDGQNIDTTNFGAYVSGGRYDLVSQRAENSADPPDNTISWSDVQGASLYNIYRSKNEGIPGFIAATQTTSFTDTIGTPDSSRSPPTFRTPFADTDNYPAAVGFYEQRRVFGGRDNSPDTSEFSRIGAFSNFTKSLVVQDDDAITATLVSNEINEIKHYVHVTDLLVFTSGAEWRIYTNDQVGFTPSSIRQSLQSTWGIGDLPPEVVGNTVLYVTPDNSNIRTLNYEIELQAFTGENLNVYSRHLLENYTITDWSHIVLPDIRFFMVRNDGALVTLSYDRSQDVSAFTTWETKGTFLATETLKGGGTASEDSAFFVVERIVDGRTVKYVEVARDAPFDDVRDCFFLDSGLTFDNPINITDVDQTNPVRVTSESHNLVNGDEIDIADIIWEKVDGENGEQIDPNHLNGKRFTVANVTTNSFDLENIDGTSFSNYISGGVFRETVTQVTGLHHLNDTTVKVLADGNVISNLTVNSFGQLTLPYPASRVHVGLPYVTELKTLRVESDPTIQGNKKKINSVRVRFFKSRNLFIGPDKDNLFEMKQREEEDYGEPIRLLTGDKEIYLSSDWNEDGEIFIRQNEPLPMTIVAVIPEMELSEY